MKATRSLRSVGSELRHGTRFEHRLDRARRVRFEPHVLQRPMGSGGSTLDLKLRTIADRRAQHRCLHDWWRSARATSELRRVLRILQAVDHRGRCCASAATRASQGRRESRRPGSSASHAHRAAVPSAQQAALGSAERSRARHGEGSPFAQEWSYALGDGMAAARHTGQTSLGHGREQGRENQERIRTSGHVSRSSHIDCQIADGHGTGHRSHQCRDACLWPRMSAPVD